MNIEKWKLLSSERVLDEKWYKVRKDVVQLPSGDVVDDYYVSERPNVVLVFALTEEEEVLLVRQYKHGAQEVVLEFPGGLVDEGEDECEAVKRELLEETGYEAGSLVFLAEMIDDPTKNTNRFFLYLAEGCKKVNHQDLDDLEEIEVTTVSIEDLEALVRDNLIITCSAVALYYKALHVISTK